jgi:hypothetical protein
VRPSDPPPRSASRAGLERSVGRLFDRPAESQAPSSGTARIARGTETPPRPAAGARATASASARPKEAPAPRKPHLANGSRPHMMVKDAANEAHTATDITAVDRAWQSMREEEETRVHLVSEVTADLVIDEIEESTLVERTPGETAARAPVIAVVSADRAPLPRLTARLRRTSSPN